MTSNIRTRRPAQMLARLATIAALAWVAGCDSNVPGTFLTPTGRPPVAANSAISGHLDFGNGSFPASLVLVAPVVEGGCVSPYTNISVSGTLVAAGFTPVAAPHLLQLAPCMWIDTLTILAGAPLEWKFTTDDNFDEAPDYGAPGTQVDGLVGTALSPSPGGDGNLSANVTATQAGVVLCTLDETNKPSASYAFTKLGPGSPAAFTSSTDGSFSITGLTPGTYNVLVRTPGSLRDTLIAGLVVNGPRDLGQLSLGGPVPVGAVSGTVDFAGPNGFADLATAPFPPFTAQLKQGTSIVATFDGGRTSTSFSFANVAPGNYEIVVDAPVFQAFTRNSIAVAAGPATDAGTFQLIKSNLEVSNTLNVAGDFNAFVADDINWEMGQTALGVWELTSPTAITAGTQFMKFVTDYTFDVPPDYGGDETVTITVPVTDQVTRKVSGSGTAIKLGIPTTGNYKFTLDERRQVFSIVTAPAPARASAMGRTRRP